MEGRRLKSSVITTIDLNASKSVQLSVPAAMLLVDVSLPKFRQLSGPLQAPPRRPLERPSAARWELLEMSMELFLRRALHSSLREPVDCWYQSPFCFQVLGCLLLTNKRKNLPVLKGYLLQKTCLNVAWQGLEALSIIPKEPGRLVVQCAQMDTVY